MKIQWQVSTIETASSSFEVSLWLSLSVASWQRQYDDVSELKWNPCSQCANWISTIDERSSSLIRGVGIATSIKPSNGV